MRNEYPRPDFIREKWMPLNGTWNFQDGTDKTPVKIQVPFPPQSRLSGFQKELTSDRITYQRNFFIPAEWIGQRILLHFGAVDYKCSVFINDHCVGFHEGGQSSFTFDITDFLSGGEETLTVAVTDYLHDETVPRGKQFWKSSGEFIWYTQSSGIWQSVWLEPVNEAHLEWIHFTPDIDQGTVEITYLLSDCTVFPCELEWDIRFKNNPVSHGSLTVSEKRGKIIVDIFKNKALRGSFHFTGWYWSPEHPNLFNAGLYLQYFHPAFCISGNPKQSARNQRYPSSGSSGNPGCRKIIRIYPDYSSEYAGRYSGIFSSRSLHSFRRFCSHKNHCGKQIRNHSDASVQQPSDCTSVSVCNCNHHVYSYSGYFTACF